MHHITSFMSKPVADSPLLIAARVGDLPSINMLLKEIVYGDLSKQEAYAVLQAAVIGMHAEIVQILLVSSRLFVFFKTPACLLGLNIIHPLWLVLVMQFIIVIYSLVL